MRRDRIAAQRCSIARSSAVIGDPWSLLVIREVFLGHRRFTELVRYTGAQPSVVSERLKRLVDAGVLERREYQQHPPRQEYRLTPMGKDLQPVLLALTHWGDTHLDDGGGPPVVNVHTTCGNQVEPVMVCGHCREPTEGRIRSEPGPGAPISRREA